jgi:hypothetical protein
MGNEEETVSWTMFEEQAEKARRALALTTLKKVKSSMEWCLRNDLIQLACKWGYGKEQGGLEEFSGPDIWK